MSYNLSIAEKRR